MSQLHIRFLIIVFLLTISMCGSVKKKKRKEFKFLGVRYNTKGRSQEKTFTNYFVSTSTTTWSGAISDCKILYGETATLLTNVDEEKFKFIQNLMQTQQPGQVGTYWIDGAYNDDEENYFWTSSGKIVPDGTSWSRNPWSATMTKRRLASQRMLLVHKKTLIEWNVDSATANKRYICEVAYSKNTCIQNTDTIFVLDNGLMKPELFPKPKSLIENIALGFRPLDSSRFGLLIYFNSHIRWVYHLTTFDDPEDVKKIFKPCQGTGNPGYCLPEEPGVDVVMGINDARKELNQNFSPGVPMNIVILTGGFTNRTKQEISTAAKSALNDAINLFVIPMWYNYDNSILPSYTGGMPERVFRVDTDDQLQSVFEKILPAICES